MRQGLWFLGLYLAGVVAVTGIAYVIVNGKMAWENGANTNNRAGKVLRRQDLNNDLNNQSFAE